MTTEQMKDALYEIKDYCQSHDCKDCYFDEATSPSGSRCFIEHFMCTEGGYYFLPSGWGEHNDY